MRSEIKYLVSTEHLPALRAQLRPFLEADPYAEGRDQPRYTVRSIYLDTFGLRYFDEKEAGLKNRLKLRVRGYDDEAPEAPVFLEIKRRFEDRIVKDRARVAFEDLNAFLQTSDVTRYVAGARHEQAADAAARKFLYHLHRYHLQPVLLVTYDREPYLCPFDRSMRLTIDGNLRSLLHPSFDELFREAELVPALPHHAIVEVKYDTRFPAWLRPILARFSLRRQALSKYVICHHTYAEWQRRPPLPHHRTRTRTPADARPARQTAPSLQ